MFQWHFSLWTILWWNMSTFAFRFVSVRGKQSHKNCRMPLLLRSNDTSAEKNSITIGKKNNIEFWLGSLTIPFLLCRNEFEIWIDRRTMKNCKLACICAKTCFEIQMKEKSLKDIEKEVLECSFGTSFVRHFTLYYHRLTNKTNDTFFSILAFCHLELKW